MATPTIDQLLKNVDQRKTSITIECFIKRADTYLMLRRNSQKRIMPGVWMAPGGHREACEGLFECARREIMEETGLKIRGIRIGAVGIAYMCDINLELHLHLLTAEFAGGDLIENPEDGDLTWLKFDEILALDGLLSELRPVLPYMFSNKCPPISYKALYSHGNEMVSFSIEDSDSE
jgi:8-oxo-dGTP diphosphatase